MLITHPFYLGKELPFNPALDYGITKAWLWERSRWMNWDDFEDRYQTTLELYLRWTPNLKVLPLTAIRRIFKTCSSQVSRVEPLDEVQFDDNISLDGIEATNEEGDSAVTVPDCLIFEPDDRLDDLDLIANRVNLRPIEFTVLSLMLEGYNGEEIGERIKKGRRYAPALFNDSILKKIQEYIK